jgi:hypothetical protein
LIESANDVSKEANNLVLGRKFDNFNDGYLEMLLNKSEFVKYKLSIEDVSYIKNKVFIDKTCKSEIVNNCAPVYKDFLLLKDNDKIISAVYICLECRQIFIYNEKETYVYKCFNITEQMELLENILKKYNLE